MSKINNVANSMISNPLVIVVIMLLIVLVVLGVLRMIMPNFSAGVGVNAHLGSIKGSVNLEAFDLENFNNQSGPQFVVFKAEWCGHCKRAMPEVQKLQQESLGNVSIVVVDSDKEPELCKEHGIQGFPTVRYYPDGLSNKSNYEDFSGERTVQGFKTFLDRLMRN